jgi:transcriptional regulator with XRE-family HTH domain
MQAQTSFPAFIRSWRERQGLKREDFAPSLGVSDKTLSRWESEGKDRLRPSHDDVLALARRTRLPAQALILLSHDYPIYFDERANRFSECAYDQALVDKDVVIHHLFEARDASDVHCPTDDELEDILELHQQVLGKQPKLPVDTLRVARDWLPTLNAVVVDANGVYAGHILVLPVTGPAHDALRTGKLRESALRREAMADGKGNPIAGFHIYDFMPVQSPHAYRLLSYFLRQLALLVGDVDCVAYPTLSRFVETTDGQTLASYLGLSTTFLDFDYQTKFGLKMTPCWMEERLGALDWFRDHLTALGRPPLPTPREQAGTTELMQVDVATPSDMTAPPP